MATNRPIAVITGATSGIGKEFARRFAQKGFDLIVTGRRKREFEKVAKAISARYQVSVTVLIGDLASQRYRQVLCRQIKETGTIDVLVNNAGFGIDRSFYNIRLEEIRSMILTHTMATVELTHTVLPGMIERRKGWIINVSSLGAFIPGLTRSLYLGTKSFVHYFTEALSTEVRPLGIKIQSLCPGMTRSDFHRNIQNQVLEKKLRLIPFMSPMQVVDTSLQSLEKGRIFCIPGAINKLFYFIAKVLPVRVLMQFAGFRNDQPAYRANLGLAT